MEPNNQQKSSFHTDQGRWDRRDFIDDIWTHNDFEGAEPMAHLEGEYHEPSGHIYSDDELESVVKELLKNSKSLDSSDLTVTAHNCDVTVSGTVKSDQQKKAVTDIVRLIHGVGKIRNDIIVKINEGILPTDLGRDD